MPRRLLKKICPSPGALQKRWYLRPFGDRIADPRLWTLHRRAVTTAFGFGLAICFIPLPVHMLVAGAIAIALRINLPAIYGTTLLVNPLTCVPCTTRRTAWGPRSWASVRRVSGSSPAGSGFKAACSRSGNRSCSAALPVPWWPASWVGWVWSSSGVGTSRAVATEPGARLRLRSGRESGSASSCQPVAAALASALSVSTPFSIA